MQSFLKISFGIKYTFFCIGAVIAAIAAYSDRFGNKTFTNDPLNWRAAKKTYIETDKENKIETANSTNRSSNNSP